MKQYKNVGTVKSLFFLVIIHKLAILSIEVFSIPSVFISSDT